MKILFLSLWYPYPADNGSKLRAYYLLRALATSHRVTLVAFHPVIGEIGGQGLGDALNHVDAHPVPVDPFRYIEVPRMLRFASPIPTVYWPLSPMRQMVIEVANSSQWDAVVALQSPMARYALLLSGVPRILDVDTALSYQAYVRYFSQVHPIARLRNWISWQKTHQYEARLFCKFQACTIVSRLELDYVTALVGASNGRVEVMRNGVDCTHNRFGISQPVPKTLVFNGALTYNVNYDAMQYFLAEIYPLIRERMSGLSLTITGANSGVDLSNLRLDESVCLSGYVDDIRPWVASAWACVVPIREGGGTRLKILEAMALGAPVVATSRGAEGLDVTDGVDILLADDPATFAKRTLQLLRDPALRQSLATNARRLVEERYDWNHIGRQFVELVEDVVNLEPSHTDRFVREHCLPMHQEHRQA